MKSNKAFVKEIRRSMERSFERMPRFVSIVGDNPFLLKYVSQQYILYVKMLSSAYFHDRPDTTRAQLPKSVIFDAIKRSQHKFLFLGCDVENGVYACWNYHKVKMRLNEKKSVSFYSRLSAQRKVKRGEFLRLMLKNGDEPVLFKWEDISGFVDKIDIFFPNSALRQTHAEDERLGDEECQDGKLGRIVDAALLSRLRPLLNASCPRTLEAISMLEAYYAKRYPKMEMRDWLLLIKNLKQADSL